METNQNIFDEKSVTFHLQHPLTTDKILEAIGKIYEVQKGEICIIREKPKVETDKLNGE